MIVYIGKAWKGKLILTLAKTWNFDILRLKNWKLKAGHRILPTLKFL